MLDRVGRPRPDRFRARRRGRLRAGALGRRGRARLHPLRGRPVVRLRRDPAGARDVDRPRHAGDARHGGADRRPGGAAARPRPARGAAARLDGGRHRRRRRSSPCCAARRCGAGWRARWRASRASTTRSRSCSSIGCIEAIQTDSFGLEDALLLAVRELSIGFVVGLAVAAVAVLFLRRVTLPSAGLYPVASVATAALAFGAALSRCTARASWRSTWPGSCSAPRRRRPGARSSPSTRASPGSPSSACSSRSGCSCSRPSSWTSSPRAPRSPS